MSLEIRPGRDEDAAGYIALISRCWADYPGVELHVDAEVPELRALASYYAGLGGMVWVAGAVMGMVAVRPRGEGVWELCKVYVHPELHGAGLAAELVGMAEAHVRGAEGTGMELWTDTRFGRAHRFYEKLGYARVGMPRELGDLCGSWEHQYGRAL